MESNFRSQLKTKTLEEHKGLEAASRIMRPAFSLKDYSDILERWFAFYSTFEVMLDEKKERFPEIYSFMSDRRKTPHLERDLKVLGRTTRIPTHTITEVHRFLTPVFETPAQLWGALYVLEGSTLGAQFITKHLTQHFEIEAENGVRFYQGYGDQTGPFWKSFVIQLEKLVLSNDEIESGVESARAMFRFFGEFLEPEKRVTTFSEQTV